MNNNLALNVGHRDYGYKNILKECGIPDWALEVKKNNLEKYLKIAQKVVIGIEIAILAFDLCTGSAFAASSGAVSVFASSIRPAVDLGPLNTFSHEIWLLMLKGILYISIPVFSWVGYILALAGSNSGKRTTAKVVGLSMVSGIAFVAGAPWAANTVFNFITNIFHV